MSKPADYVDCGLNLQTGCDPAFDCWKRCWARRMALRLAGNSAVKDHFMYDHFQPTLWPERVEEVKKWRQPRHVALNWMGDMFAKGQRCRWQCVSMDVVAAYPQHTWLILTKRANLMADFFAWAEENVCEGDIPENAWLGVSVSRPTDLERVKWLNLIHCSVRWVSFEPALEEINFTPAMLKGISWLVYGAETGPGKRPDLGLDYAMWLYKLCKACGVKFWDKKNVLGLNIKERP